MVGKKARIQRVKEEISSRERCALTIDYFSWNMVLCTHFTYNHAILIKAIDLSPRKLYIHIEFYIDFRGTHTPTWNPQRKLQIRNEWYRLKLKMVEVDLWEWYTGGFNCIGNILFLFSVKISFLSHPHTQHGAQTHNTEIKSHLLHQLSQPVAPVIFYFLS